MRVKYPSHLYIRVDRPLREDINKAAECAGLNVSTFARKALRAALDGGHRLTPRQRGEAA